MEKLPDNYDMWEANERRRAKKEEQMIHCCHCEEPIYPGERYFNIDSEPFCKECVDDEFGTWAE